MHAKDDDPDSGSADLFDRKQIRDYLGFVAGAIKRRRRLAAAVFSSIVVLVIAGLAALPKTYHAETRLFAQSNPALEVRNEGKDGPTRGAVEMIRRRDNLVALVEVTDLVHHWDAHLAPARRMLRAIRRLAPSKEDDQDRIDAMVERLEKQLVVGVSEGTVTIAIDWPDAEMARWLVDIAQQNFLEARHAQEITALSESLSILRNHNEGLRKDIDDAVTALDDVRAHRQRPKAGGESAAPGAASAAPSAPGTPAVRRVAEPRLEAEQIQATIVAKQRALDDLEAFRRHRLSEAQARLAEQRATYTDNHPTIIDLSNTITSLSVPSPQIKALREEIASLRTQDYRLRAEAGIAPLAAPGAIAQPGQGRSEILILDQSLRDDRDPATMYARGRLLDAMHEYTKSREKIEVAQIDLETAEVAFKYRYSVITPAKLPKKPVKPNAPVVLAAALVAAGLAAVLVAVVADIRSGKLLEPWQVERLLDRPILGEIAVQGPWRRDAR